MSAVTFSELSKLNAITLSSAFLNCICQQVNGGNSKMVSLSGCTHRSPTHSLTQSFTHSLACSHTHQPTHLHSYSLTHSPTLTSLTHSLGCSLTQLVAYSLIRLFTHLLCQCTQSFAWLAAQEAAARVESRPFTAQASTGNAVTHPITTAQHLQAASTGAVVFNNDHFTPWRVPAATLHHQASGLEAMTANYWRNEVSSYSHMHIQIR